MHTASKQVRDLAMEQPSSVRVFERFGIDYCCGGRKPLDQVCNELQLSLEQVLEKLEQASKDDHAEPPEPWLKKPLAELAAHITTRHHGYCREELPRLVALSEKVNNRHGKTMSALAEMQSMVSELSAEMTRHMLKEEQVLFPHIEKIEQACDAGKPVPPAFFGTVANPIQTMMSEHDHAGEIVAGLRKMSNGFEPPDWACPTFRAFYSGMQDFELDLHRHVHLENNILFPRALRLEGQKQS